MTRFALFTCLVLLSGFDAIAFGQQRCLKTAWAAYDKQQYTAAIASAEQCIASFGARAQKDQSELPKTSLPPTGTVADAGERQRLLARWSINDVAASHWIVGASSQQLYTRSKNPKHLDAAKRAFKAATALPAGRVLDPQSEICCFWSPAEEAQIRLQQLGSS